MAKRASVIYVVDDDVACRTALGRWLRVVGYQPRSFSSGEEVLADTLEGVIPDCMILDLLMPGMSGLELLERLALAGRHYPTIVLTACSLPEKAFLAGKRGASDFIRKPVNTALLLRKIRKVLAAQRAKELPRDVRRREAQELVGRLSSRERQVLVLLDGRERKQIAADLGIGFSTVKSYCDSIFKKLGVHSSRAALQIWRASVRGDRD